MGTRTKNRYLPLQLNHAAPVQLLSYFLTYLKKTHSR